MLNNKDFQNDWMMLKANNEVPEEIIDFMQTVFQIMEIRARVGTEHGIIFEVRSREQNHSKPHVHARYDKHSISIDIKSGEVLAGNLPKSQQTKAVEWVKNHKEYLLGKWNDIAISAISCNTKSNLG